MNHVIVVSEHVDLMPSEDGQLTETCKSNQYIWIESHYIWAVCCIHIYTFTLNITVFNAALSTSVFYSSTTCFGHIGPSSGTIAIIATVVSL
jgi:cytolysin (calcineurin-like family phosphatase)